MYSAEEVDEVVEVHPPECEHCGMALEGLPQEDREWAHQVVELPDVKPHVTEYRVHSRKCPGCGKRTQAPLPEGVPTRPYGPRLQATGAVLTGRYRLSRREAKNLLCDLFQVDMSLGALSGLEKATSDALGDVVEGAQEAVRDADVVNMDETSWKEADERAWLWTAVTELVSLFKIASTRSGEVVDELLGAGFGGVVGSDRYSAYKRIPLEQRSVCLSHLKRNFKSLVDRGGQAQFVGVWGLVELERVFRLWHKYKAGNIDRKTLKRRLRPIKRSFGELLEYGKVCGGRKAEGMCWEVSAVWEALWRFSEVEGVEPTNNAAERALRPAVLWRKGSFGSQSNRGSRFVERMLTVAASCRQQKRHLLTFLEQVCRAAISGTSPPSLVPSYTPG